MLAAVVRPEYTALLLRPGQSAERAREDIVRIVRIDDDSPDTPSLIEPHMLPGLASVDGFVNTITRDIAVSYGPCFSSARPNNTRVRLGHGEGSDRGYGLLIENRREAVSAVNALPDPAGSRPGVVDIRVAGYAGHRSDTVPNKRTQETKSEVVAILRMDKGAETKYDGRHRGSEMKIA